MRRRLLTPSAKALEGLELPLVELEGAADGPTLTLIAGVHGCEYTSQLALRRLPALVDEARLRGRIRLVPTVNVEAFFARSPFVSPRDGKNLNRCFPGDPEGTYSEALAHVVTEELIKGSDYLVDLHAGDMVEDLYRFTISNASAVAGEARRMADAYGFPISIEEPAAKAAVNGSTSQLAAQLGIPGIIAESGRCGLVEEEAVRHHLDGLSRLLAALELYDSSPPEAPLSVRRFGRFDWLRCAHAGWWSPAVAVGDDVEEGQLLGTVSDLFGEVLEEVHAPGAGVPVFCTSSPAVLAEGLLMGIAADELALAEGI